MATGARRKDLDLLVDLSAENWPRLQAALKPLSAGVPSFEDLSPERKYQARLRFYETVELLTAIGGVSFADALGRKHRDGIRGPQGAGHFPGTPQCQQAEQRPPA